jgi:hypothetical protein
MTLSQFLLRLAAEPALLEEFNKEPQVVATRLGLREDQQRLLAPGQLDNLRVEIKTELRIDDEAAMIIWLHQLPPIHWLFAAPDDTV